MSETNFLYWMAVSESEPVRFSELSHMMAKAMYPSDAELNHYASTRVNLDSELPRAVREGELVVRNPAGMGKHTFPYGAALQSAVILPDDLRPFLAERGIELRLTPHGSGPEYWTLENAAVALQDQEGWHGGTRAAFLDQLQDAAQHGAMVIRDPQTCLAIRPQIVRTFWELVTPADVNAWLEKQAAPYRWNAEAPQAAAPAPAAKETPAERRARWLDMFEAEEKLVKRGALQRLATREGVDRSNMGKDIAKARAERADQKRAGGWASQLVQDGKRKS